MRRCFRVSSCLLVHRRICTRAKDGREGAGSRALQMKYDAKMKVDSSDADFDFDSYFTFNTPSDNGFVSFFIFNVKIDEEQAVKDQVAAMSKEVMKEPTVTKLETWGKYKGHGAVMKGKLMGLMKGEIRIFAYGTDDRSILVVYQVYESDKPLDLPGLELMEKTFTLK